MFKKTLLTLILAASTLVLHAAEGEYRNAIKSTFLSWATGAVKIYYQRAFDSKNSAETATGMICAAFDKYDNNPQGFLLRAGYLRTIGLNASQKPMQGLYLKPEFLYSNFRYDYDLDETPNPPSPRGRSEMWTVMLNIGYQYVWNRFTIDAYWGFGYADGTECDTWYEHGFLLCDMLGIKEKHLSLGSGIKLGVAF